MRSLIHILISKPILIHVMHVSKQASRSLIKTSHIATCLNYRKLCARKNKYKRDVEIKESSS